MEEERGTKDGLLLRCFIQKTTKSVGKVSDFEALSNGEIFPSHHSSWKKEEVFSGNKVRDKFVCFWLLFPPLVLPSLETKDDDSQLTSKTRNVNLSFYCSKVVFFVLQGVKDSKRDSCCETMSLRKNYAATDGTKKALSGCDNENEREAVLTDGSFRDCCSNIRVTKAL